MDETLASMPHWRSRICIMAFLTLFSTVHDFCVIESLYPDLCVISACFPPDMTPGRVLSVHLFGPVL